MGLSLLVAFCAGCGNVVLTNPIWVVATRMQAHQNSEGQGKEGEARSTPTNVAREIYEESGLKVSIMEVSLAYLTFLPAFQDLIQCLPRWLSLWHPPALCPSNYTLNSPFEFPYGENLVKDREKQCAEVPSARDIGVPRR